jgi:hypothetical protein
METQTVAFSELIHLTLFLGIIVFLFGTAYQTIALIWLNKRVKWNKIIGIILVTRILTIFFTLFLWKVFFQNIDIMLGPILLPGFIAELILSPLILKLLKFNVIRKR